MTRRPIRRGPPVPSPLTMDEVYAQVATRPLTTAEITEYCQTAHPDYPGVVTRRVHRHLEALERRSRVQSWACTDTTALAARGVDEPVNKARYWALPSTEEHR